MSRFNKRNPWKYILFTVMVCLVLSLGLYQVMGMSAGTVTPAAVQPSVNQRTINVAGSAEILVAPDEVDITVGIETRDPDFKKAKAQNDENSKKVIKLAGQYGIDAKYVQSDYIRTFPAYDYENHVEAYKILYYDLQKRIVIKLKDIGRFEAFTSDLLEDGKVSIQSIEFLSTQISKYKNEARKLAAKAAKDKAQLLAGELGSGVSKPATISEEQVDSTTWYGSWWGSLWYGYGQPAMSISNVSVNYQNNVSVGNGQDQNNGTIAIGQIRITAKIGVIFELS